MSDAAASTPKKEPTAHEAMFFYAIVKHMKNKADIDWEAVASEQGFKNAEVAKVCPSQHTSDSGAPSLQNPRLIHDALAQVRFGQVKRKLGINASAETPTSSARASGKKRDAAPGATPTKVAKNTGRAGAKGKGGGRGRGKVKKEEAVDDDECPEAEAKAEGNYYDDDDATVKDEYMPPSQFEENMRAVLGEDDPF
ncbi:hypothetical protein HIM_00231 [Hirsutella minnesotensis 3608]|nr:hypothetical protein HIM_00231 [Hirsutella minnesotensis 3608]